MTILSQRIPKLSVTLPSYPNSLVEELKRVHLQC